ncbi:hypothetical protein [Falsiroseomonas sp. E2-1-a20]|uniref:hypothetical protein n=1 Tax=Falsiroseomonas sp. E2-1-a20 TaxID=3239300 RepID=UPI003F3F9952
MSGTEDPGATRTTESAADPGSEASAPEPKVAPLYAPEGSTAAGGEAGILPVDAGVAEVAPNTQAPQARGKAKGIADIVFMIDVSGSMEPCISALRMNIEAFAESLSRGDANNAAPVKDWRAKVVGYRDLDSAEGEGIPWIVDNPFVRDVTALKAQLAGLHAMGGGDEPESLLDALFKVATMEAMPKGSQSVDHGKWRYRSDAARVVIVFTDASFKETMGIPEAKGGSLQDVANVVMANRIILSLFAPNFEGYDRLSQIDKSEWEVVEYDGLSPQAALQRFTSDPVNFRNTLKQLAASVSRSAETVVL